MEYSESVKTAMWNVDRGMSADRYLDRCSQYIRSEEEEAAEMEVYDWMQRLNPKLGDIKVCEIAGTLYDGGWRKEDEEEFALMDFLEENPLTTYDISRIFEYIGILEEEEEENEED